jgi:hypothetical protein
MCTSLTNGVFIIVEGDCSFKSSPTNNPSNNQLREAPPYSGGGSVSMEILESLIKQLFTYCSERIRDHCYLLYPFLCGEELCNFFTRLNMVRKGGIGMAWCWWGTCWGWGPNVYSHTRAMPAWSVNWCACSNHVQKFHNLEPMTEA